ncbi:ribonuclease domain-containing protein [Methanosphaera sp. WGK6]|uniref:ribonuclease domain-containing protein n=1 Tax=Methanosphaera sp. WGK6 TaxID=1561964 RepID=UPI00084C8F3B|nr:ribonuclease domain-containing protein [Methanosphaera sp. WGK6]OED29832.1 ribonuclease [Methanosphaera sp. WGK6]
MNKKIISTVTLVIIAILVGLFGTDSLDSDGYNINASLNNTTVDVIETGEYCSVDEVAAYIKTYHKLPSNYITKKEAQRLGWTGGSLASYAPGKSIGGDVFTNRQGVLPHSDKKYIECDIDANGTNRGAKRIVYSTENYKVYYTSNHYETFTEI